MYIFLMIFIFRLIDCTIDINLAEMEYIANQLNPVECENLENYLHSHNYEVTTRRKFFSFGERSCLEILIHWNNSPNEGSGETHTVLAHRLNQIGRKDLAEWLSSTVFSRLSMKLNKSVLANPFKNLIMETTIISEAEAEASSNNSDLSFYTGEPEWETYDTVAVVVAIFLLITVLTLVCELCGCFKCLQKEKKKKKNIKFEKKQKYSLLPQEEGSSPDEECVNML